MVAICLQRMPVLSREKALLEVEYEQLSDQIKMERSKLSDFELEEQKYEEMKKARIKKALEEDVDTKVCDHVVLTLYLVLHGCRQL